MAISYGSRGAGSSGGGSSGLYEVLDLILDKGLVIDAYVRVSLVGIEILTIDARIVVASVDTYLRFAEAVNRLELGGGEEQNKPGVPDLLSKGVEGGARSKAKGALSGAGESISNALGSGGDKDQGPGLMDRAREAIGERLGGDGQETEESEGDEESQPALPQRSESRRASGTSGSRAQQQERRPPQRGGR
jgi:hypothetical protein